jgi:hypothetical protein
MFGMGQQELEEEFTLVELTVYGIASLYERFPPKPPAPEGSADPNAPAPAAPGG